MNKKLVFLIIPLIILVCIIIYKKNIKENFEEFPMTPGNKIKYDKCKALRNKIISDGKQTILWKHLTDPKNPADYPYETGAEIDPEKDINNLLVANSTDTIALKNYKENCSGGSGDPANYLVNPNHINHTGAINIKWKINKVEQKIPSWAKDGIKNRYSLPVHNISRIDRTNSNDSFIPIMGDINVYSPTIIEKGNDWKWFSDGKLEEASFFDLKNPEFDGETEEIKFKKWNEIHPYDAAKANGEKLQPRDSYYIDIAQSDATKESLPNPNNNSPKIKDILKNWGNNYGNNPNIKRTLKGEPYSSTGNSIEDEKPFNQMFKGEGRAYDGIPIHISNIKSGGCTSVSTKKPGKAKDIVPLMKLYDAYPEKDKENGPTKDFFRETNIISLKDFEEHQYKRKMLPVLTGNETGTKINLDDVHQYGKAFSDSSNAQKGYNHIKKKGNKVLASSGYDYTQYSDENGDLIDNAIATHKIEISQEKKCPEPIEHRYYYEKPGLPAFSEWYIGEIGGSFSKDLPKVTKNQTINQQCTQCSNPGGCKYPNAEGGKFSADYFEFQKCKDGKDRICKKCKTCKMGLELADSGCGEGGGKSDRSCCLCSDCPDGTYKVFGCDKPNSFFDTECKPISKCQGFKPKNSEELVRLMEEYPEKYKFLNTFNKDPGEDNRLYILRKGLKGGFEDRNKIDPVTGHKLKNPYFGRDTKCDRCDTCPPGWKHLRGCMGTNDTENTVCQRTMDKKKYLDKAFQCPKGQFYSKDNISKKIDELNKDIEKKDEKMRTAIKAQNDEIISDPLKLRTMKLININDPKNFPDQLPQLTDEDLRRIGCATCKVCPGEISHRDPDSPGCLADKDTNCKPQTPCKDFQFKSKDGDSFNDQLCSSCRCPQPDYYGIPDCKETTKDEKGTYVPKGCKRKDECKLGEYVSNDPGIYGDTTKPRICQKCKKCNYGTFEVKGGCRLGGGTDTVCKNWKQCDKKSMLVIEPGTSEKDTICKCLDGFELPKDEITGNVDLEASKCVPIQGKCYTNPCHPNANCFDNFTDSGQYMDTICKCDINKGFIQTEDKGFGKDGCFSVPVKHSHEIRTPAASYGDLPPKFAKILTHVDDKFHRKKIGKHLHKNAPLKLNDDGVII